MSAKLIMFDGPDGVGKTTQIALVKDTLEQKGVRTYVTRINGGSHIGEALRETYLSEYPRPAATDFYLGLAIYAAFVEEIQGLRANYDVILVDRSPFSNVAYQSFGSGYDREESIRACETTLSALQPDLIICYAAPLAVLRQRLAAGAHGKADFFESKPDDFFERVVDGYAFCAARYDATIIDARASVADVKMQTMQAVTSVLA
jgi:dTMP kinase